MHSDTLMDYEHFLAKATHSAEKTISDRLAVIQLTHGDLSNADQKTARLSDWLFLVDLDVKSQRNAVIPVRNKFLMGSDIGEIEAKLTAETCEESRTLSGGDFGTTLVPGKQVWFAIAVKRASLIQVSTAGSNVDTQLSVYGSTCPGADDLPAALQDDDVGLAARYASKLAPNKTMYFALTSQQAGQAQVHIALANGTVTGFVRDTFGNLPTSASVSAVLPGPNAYYSVGSTSVGVDGSYSLSLPPGDYRFVMRPFENYLGQVYPNIDCSAHFWVPPCQYGLGQERRVYEGQATTGINFTLSAGAEISGISQPFAEYTAVQLRNGTAPDYEMRIIDLDSQGRYKVQGLMPSNYTARVFGGGLHRDQVYNGWNCPLSGCDLLLAEYIYLNSNEKRRDINFTPIALPRIHGKVSTTEQGQIASVTAYYPPPYSGQGTRSTDVMGNYSFPLSVQGVYYFSFSSPGFVPQLYANLPCVSLTAGCLNYLDGTPINLSDGQIVELNAVLTKKASIRGRVLDDLGRPIFATIYLCVATESRLCNMTTTYSDSNGYYRFNQVDEGNYFILAKSSQHIDRAYPDIDCQILPDQACNITASGGRSVTATDGLETQIADMNLTRAASISGFVNGFGQRDIEIYQVGNTTFYKMLRGEFNNSYKIDDLVEGAYKIIVKPSIARYFPQIYSNRSCVIDGTPSCDINLGETIYLNTSQSLSGINFALEDRLRLGGEVRLANRFANETTGVDLWKVQPTPALPVKIVSVTVGSFGKYFVFASDFNARNYYLSTNAPGQYLNQIFSGVSCAPSTSALAGTCSFQGATEITLPAASPQQFGNLNFNLMMAPEFTPIYSDGFE